jgi:hypothetical protein
MSLTEEAYFERKWEGLPILANLIGKKQLSMEWCGESSVADNIIDRVNRTLEIYASVEDNRDKIKNLIINSKSNIEMHKLLGELEYLQIQLMDLSERFKSYALRLPL